MTIVTRSPLLLLFSRSAFLDYSWRGGSERSFPCGAWRVEEDNLLCLDLSAQRGPGGSILGSFGDPLKICESR